VLQSSPSQSATPEVFVHVEGPGALLPAQGVRQAGFLVRNARGVFERVYRSGAFIVAAGFHPFLRGSRPDLAHRALCICLRSLTRDRLDFLGEEYVQRVLWARLDPGRVARLQRHLDQGDRVVLVSSWLDHIVRPLARKLGVERILCNRLEFRDGISTGRLLDPVVTHRSEPGTLRHVMASTANDRARNGRTIVVYDAVRPLETFSVRETLRGREVLLVGVTGFIGKVWLANLLKSLPDVGRVHVLIRPKGPLDAAARFERVVRESPPLQSIDPGLLSGKVSVVQGDMCEPDLGLAPEDRERLQESLDVIVNSGGLTEFNPDLRAALSANVDSTLHAVRFLRKCRKAALMHLSTVYVAGRRGGRIPETVEPNYSPLRRPDFDAERVLEQLRTLVEDTERRAESDDVVPPMRPRSGKVMTETQLRKARQRWLRAELARLGTDWSVRHGWPNTYTLTKSLAESLLERHGRDLPIAIVRPSVVETSADQPFRGWNEGVNTSAPLSWLCGTLFRQLPTKRGNRLDVIPVDLVTRGMTLIAAALVRRFHHRCYQLATSVANPCGMPRMIELTALAHRKHYRDRPGLDAWLRTHSESVPVSMRRYRALSAPAQKAVVRTLRRVLPFVGTPLRRMERSLDRVEKLIELFEPFIYENDYAFEADHIGLLNAALVPEERDDFGYDADSIDWLEYWIDIHIPALRKWSYPLIEGRPVEA